MNKWPDMAAWRLHGLCEEAMAVLAVLDLPDSNGSTGHS